MTCLLVLMWLFVVGMGIRAVVTRQILWPQKQEDCDEDLREVGKRRAAYRQSRMNSMDPLFSDTEAGYNGRAPPDSRRV